MKRSVIWWVIVVVVLVVVFGVLSRPSPLMVDVVKVDTGRVESTVANTRAGTVKACLRSKLSLPIGGQINKVLVSEGDLVTQGQLLMVLWNEDRAAKLGQSKALLVSARNDREGVCITANADMRESNRLKGLLDSKLVSEELADRAAAKAEASAFVCKAAKSRELEAQAAIKLAEVALEQTYLRAPFAGKVAEVTGEVGEFSTPSPIGIATPPAIDLLTSDCHYVSAPIDEVDAANVRPGMDVRITLDAFQNRNFPGRLRRVAPYVLDLEKQARTVEVEVDFDDASLTNLEMLAGYSADVEIIIDTRDNVLKVPTELIVDESHVMVVTGENLLKLQNVKTGISNWRDTEIVSGLNKNDEIVSSLGSPGVEPGRKAEVKRE